MKKAINVMVRRNSEDQFKHHQYLMLSEARYLSQIAQEFSEVKIHVEQMPVAKFKSVFGK